MKKPTILFMGTPVFAIAPLAGLLKEFYPVIGVVTPPDRPRGRGKLLSFAPIKAFALEHKLPLFQPEWVGNDDFLDILAQLSPELIVVAAFGQLLPPPILTAAPMGCLNIHPSLLPKYRGAAPISRAIMAGETATGVTIMLLDEGMDSGNILLQEETPIPTDETFGSLQDRLSQTGSELLLKTIRLMAEGALSPRPQDHLLATFAPRIKKAECLINWELDVSSIVNLIRGISPSPGAHTFVGGKQLKILNAVGRLITPQEPPGTLIPTADGISVAAADGYVLLKTLQWENRKALPVAEFKGGFRPPPGTVRCLSDGSGSCH